MSLIDKSFITYQKQVISNAKHLSECLVTAGFNIVSGGTDTHLLLLDLSNKNIRVNSISAGYIKSNMTSNSYKNIKRRKYISKHNLLNYYDASNLTAVLNDFIEKSISPYVEPSQLNKDV